MAEEKDNQSEQTVEAGSNPNPQSASGGKKYTGNTKEEKWYNPKDIEDYNIESYIEKRWGDQFGYFEKRSGYNRDWYNRIQFLIIFLGALSVVILSFNLDGLLAKWFPCMSDRDLFSVTNFLCALMSGTIVVLTGYDKLKQFSSEWTNKRKAQENLKTEICKFKFGVEPYSAPEIEKPNESKPENPNPTPDKDTKASTSERTKTLFAKLDEIVGNYDDTSFKNAYKSIKNEISSYLSSANDYNGKPGEITSKDKIFVSRVNAVLEDCQRLVYGGNLFRVIKDEIADFYTNSGSYKVEPSVKPPKKDSREEILAKNERLFVARVEAIIAQDVEEFVTAKTKAEQKKSGDGKEEAKK